MVAIKNRRKTAVVASVVAFAVIGLSLSRVWGGPCRTSPITCWRQEAQQSCLQIVQPPLGQEMCFRGPWCANVFCDGDPDCPCGGSIMVFPWNNVQIVAQCTGSIFGCWDDCAVTTVQCSHYEPCDPTCMGDRCTGSGTTIPGVYNSYTLSGTPCGLVEVAPPVRR